MSPPPGNVGIAPFPDNFHGQYTSIVAMKCEQEPKYTLLKYSTPNSQVINIQAVMCDLIREAFPVG
jgi:hypothetical protein